jgi:hypothetical protein
MSNRVQIAMRNKDREGRIRWKLVAHGAPYDRATADEYVNQYGKANIRLLPLPKNQ